MKIIAPEGKKVRTVIHVKDYTIKGQIVAYDNYNGRVSDVINYDNKFLNITNVEITSSDGTVFYKGDYLCLNKDVIIFFYTEE